MAEIDYGPYHRALAEARDQALVLSDTQALAFLDVLRDHVAEIAAEITSGRQAARGPAATRAVVRRGIQDMIDELERVHRAGIRLTTRTVAEIHARATVALVGQLGSTALTDTAAAVMGRVSAPALQAVIARPMLTSAMVSIRQDATAAADAVLRRGILAGGDPESTARALRLHIVGADAFPPGALDDLRRIGYGTLEAMGLEPTPENLAMIREKAAEIARRARLMARTEIMVAEHETAIQAAVESPVVELLRWTLSNRHPADCECDALAEVDWYGHGPGLYTPAQFPARPHPRCLCGRLHVLRDPADWGSPKQTSLALLAREPEAVGEEMGFYPSRRRSLARALGIGRNPGRAASTEPGAVTQARIVASGSAAALAEAREIAAAARAAALG